MQTVAEKYNIQEVCEKHSKSDAEGVALWVSPSLIINY
jgi:hypothetical protein